MQTPSKIILGIDPGTVIMGYGLVRCTGSQITLIEMGVLKLPVRQDAYARLQLIHEKVRDLIGKWQPHDFAIEAPFFGKNVQSMLKLGRAQGVAIATAMNAGLPVSEYSPKKVKQSITGNGNSEKEQVYKMLQQLLQFTEEIQSFDASDALAVAVCHYFQHRTEGLIAGAGQSGKAGANNNGSGKGKKLNGWEDFVRNNPGKVRSK